MKDYLDYRTARMKRAWGGRISPSAVESAVQARFMRRIGRGLLVLAAVVLIVQFLLYGLTLPLSFLMVAIFLAGFFQGRAHEHSVRGSEEVLAQYDLPRSSRWHFYNLDLETFDQKLSSARDEDPWTEPSTLVLEDPPLVTPVVQPELEPLQSTLTKTPTKKAPARRPAAKKIVAPKPSE